MTWIILKKELIYDEKVIKILKIVRLVYPLQKIICQYIGNQIPKNLMVIILFGILQRVTYTILTNIVHHGNPKEHTYLMLLKKVGHVKNVLRIILILLKFPIGLRTTKI